MFIIELYDDYGSKYYGPFQDMEAVKKWVKDSLKDKAGHVDKEDVYIWRGEHASVRSRIGTVIELTLTYVPGIIRDGH